MKFYSIKEGKFQIDLDSVVKYLSRHGFYKYEVNNNQIWIVKVDGKVVKKFEPEAIYNFLLDRANTEKYNLAQYRITAIDRLTKMRGRIIANITVLLPSFNGEFYTDNKHHGYMIYKNLILTVTKESITHVTIKDAEKFIWEHSIIARNIKIPLRKSVHDSDSPFYSFLSVISTKDGEDGLQSLISIFGFLLHTYKDKTFAKAVIIYDKNINIPDPNGRSGKSLFVSALKHLRATEIEDGKKLNPKNQFSFSRAKSHPKIFIIDDVKRNYPFDELFTQITSDFVYERKSIDRDFIPFEISPKLVLTSNYDILGMNHSHRDRRIEYVIDNYFDADYKPLDFFEKELFDGWDEDEWNAFDQFGALALQFYLQNGIIEQEPSKLYYLLMRNTSEEFIMYADQLEPLIRYNLSDSYESFKLTYSRLPFLHQNTFTRWLKMYCDYKNWNLVETHSNRTKFIQFTEKPTRQDRPIQKINEAEATKS